MVSSAAIYVRISRDKDGLGAGVERQIQDCQGLADQLGWSVRKVYQDNDVSAFTGKVRPEYQALLDDLAAGLVDAILVWHTDRLHRRPIELEAFIDLVEDRDIQIRAVQGGALDLGSSAGRMTARILGSVARQESEHKGDRIRRARQQRALEGRWNGGRRCYGYETDGHTVQVLEAKEVATIADNLIAGLSLRAVVRDLNERGISTTNGGVWSSTAVRELMLSPRIAGLSVYKGEVVGQAKWPRLLSEDVWRAVGAILSDPSRKTNHRGAAVRWFGSGIYRCGVCGSSDVRVSSVDGRRRYRCRNRIAGQPTVHVGRDAALLDEYIEALIIARLSRPDFLEALPTPDTKIDVTELQGERRVFQVRQVQLSDAFARGEITLSQLTTGTRIIEGEIDAIEEQLARMSSSSVFNELYRSNDVRAMWDSMALDKRRVVLESLMTVTILRTKPGRAANGSYFRTEDIQIEWKS